MKKVQLLFKGLLLLSLYFVLAGFTVIGHRGEPSKALEHSFAGYDAAIDDGADYLELDLRMSSDSVLVVSHDDQTYRTTNQDLVISQEKWAQLKDVKLKNGENLHNLEAVFQRYQGQPQVKFMIESRLFRGFNLMEEPLVKLIKQYHLEQRVYFESFEFTSLQKLHQLLPAAPTMLLIDQWQARNRNYLLSLHEWSYLFITAIGFPMNTLMPEVDALRSLDKELVPYTTATALDLDQVRANIKNFTGVFTNDSAAYSEQLYPLIADQATVQVVAPAGARIYTSAFNQASRVKERILKTGSRWKIFGYRETPQGIVYHLGGNQWIKQQDVTKYVAPVKENKLKITGSKGAPLVSIQQGASKPLRTLKVNTTWRYFDQTKVKGQVYLNLGGNQWVSRELTNIR